MTTTLQTAQDAGFLPILCAHNVCMSTPAAKICLRKADRMMRQRVPEELPVLTDLIVERSSWRYRGTASHAGRNRR